MARQRETETQGGLFMAERSLATLLGAVALVLGAIGILRGFGLIGTDGAILLGAEAVEGPLARGEFWDAMVWMLPGVAAAILAIGVGRSEHQHTGPVATSAHSGAYIMAVVAIVLGVLGVLVGFNLLGQDNVQTDGVIWGFSSVISGAIGAAFHMAAPALVPDEEYLVRVVESRVAAGARAGGTVPGTERAS